MPSIFHAYFQTSFPAYIRIRDAYPKQIKTDGAILTPFLPVHDSNWGISGVYDEMHKKKKKKPHRMQDVFAVLSPRTWITEVVAP